MYLEATYVGADQALLSLRSLLNNFVFVAATFATAPLRQAVNHFGFRPRRKHFLSSRLKYYSTNDGSFQLMRIAISGDISPNPGSSSVCSICNRTITQNHRALDCNDCKSQHHIKCVKVTPNQFKQMRTQNLTRTLHLEGFPI